MVAGRDRVVKFIRAIVGPSLSFVACMSTLSVPLGTQHQYHTSPSPCPDDITVGLCGRPVYELGIDADPRLFESQKLVVVRLVEIGFIDSRGLDVVVVLLSERSSRATPMMRSVKSLLQSVAWRSLSLARACARPSGTTSRALQLRPPQITTVAGCSPASVVCWRLHFECSVCGDGCLTNALSLRTQSSTDPERIVRVERQR